MLRYTKGMKPSDPSFNICVGTVFHDDPSIFRMIDSIPESWEIIIIDGRFTGSRAKEEFSSKYLRSKILTYPNTTILDGIGMEYENRNRYLEASEWFDFLMVLDSDEWIDEFNPELFYNYISHLTEGLHSIEGDDYKYHSRLHVKPSEWRYYKSHKYFKHNGEIRNVNKGDSKVNGIKISMNDDLRSKELINTIHEYQKQLWKYEDTLDLP